MSLTERLLAALPAAATASAAQARERFVEFGLPNSRVESWRYSALRGLESLDPTAADTAPFAAAQLDGLSGTLAALIGGSWQTMSALPPGLGLAIAPSAGLRAPSELALNMPADSASAFALLNLAGAAAGLDLIVDAPVLGIWGLSLQHETNGLLQVDNRIRVHSGGAITLLEHWTGADQAGGLLNTLLDIELETDSELTLIRVQELGSKAQAMQTTTVRCADRARFNLVTLELGGLWTRHDVSVDLNKAGASANVTGLVALQGRQHHDTQLALRHLAGAAQSRTLWKAVANQRARSVFNGLIRVAPGADLTEAHLKTANLLLSAHAEIDTKPELVIEADEVVCSHGATVGQLDDRALFYLRSRGIPEAQARQILTLAFGGEVLAAIADSSLRAALSARVNAHLPQTFAE